MACRRVGRDPEPSMGRGANITNVRQRSNAPAKPSYSKVLRSSTWRCTPVPPQHCLRLSEREEVKWGCTHFFHQ